MKSIRWCHQQLEEPSLSLVKLFLSGTFTSVKTENRRDFENKGIRITQSRFNSLDCDEIQHHLC